MILDIFLKETIAHSTWTVYSPVEWLETPVCTPIVDANLGPWVPGPQDLGSPDPGSSDPVNIVSPQWWWKWFSN